jgi:hypothetical protein
MSVAHQIKNIFFTNSIVKIDVSVQGQKCDGNVFVLGASAGPSRDLSNLLHEVAHFAELEVDRLATFPAGGWGLSMGKFWQIGTAWGHEPHTDQQVQREARVWAMQLSAERHFNIRDSATDLVKSAVWLPAWCHYRRKVTPDTFKDNEALDALAFEVDALTKVYSFDRLVEDFSHRVNHLTKLVA